jgi:hypothetical protein
VNKIKISLSTIYDVAPSHLKIECLGEVIYEGELTKNTIIEHEIGRLNPFELKITKTGKTKEIVDIKSTQEVVVELVNLNGINLKIQDFGSFSLGDNPYVAEETLQTNKLNFNGVWTLELPRLNLVGDITKEAFGKMRNTFSDSDVACFGCSQTYGALIGHDQAWPGELSRLTGKSVGNYGVNGSNINEITAMVDEYLKEFKTDIVLLYLPHTFRRQIKKGNEAVNMRWWDDYDRDLLLHGEEHSIAVLAGAFMEWLENISKHTKIYFGTYQTDEYRLYQQTPLKKFMFPFLEGVDYPKASDGVHHGPEFNQDLAKILKDFLQTG